MEAPKKLSQPLYIRFDWRFNMRGKMKWLFVFCLLTIVVATPLAATALNDSERPGSVLVFPFFETGTVATADQGVLPVTSFEISVACPKGSTCVDGQDVDLRAHWVCGNQLCSERDFVLDTTVNGTILFNPGSRGSIPTPPCRVGYLIVWVADESNRAIKFDGLIGDAVIRESSGAVTAYNAIPIQAAPALATGAFTDVNHNGALDFNGAEYQTVTGKIYGSVRYDVITATGFDQVRTSLILLTLDTLSNSLNNPVFVALNFYNESEALNSNSTAFFCWEEQTFSGMGLDNTFGTKGLVESTRAVKVAFVGGDKTGPVTLLGLVLTREYDPVTSGLLRHYAYELKNDGTPRVTAFVP
jgi:hypothetical protein